MHRHGGPSSVHADTCGIVTTTTSTATPRVNDGACVAKITVVSFFHHALCPLQPVLMHSFRGRDGAICAVVCCAGLSEVGLGFAATAAAALVHVGRAVAQGSESFPRRGGILTRGKNREKNNESYI